MRRIAFLLTLLPAVALGGASRDFDGSADHLSVSTAALTGGPAFLACWGQSDHTFSTNSGNGTGLSMSPHDWSGGWMSVKWRADSSFDNREIHSESGSATQRGSSTWTTGDWVHGAASFVVGEASKVYFNATEEGDLTGTFSAPSGIGHTDIGTQFRGDPQNRFDGRLSNCACWNVKLTLPERLELRFGMPPSHVNANALRGWWPLMETTASAAAQDLSYQKINLTATSDPPESTAGPPFVYHPIGGN